MTETNKQQPHGAAVAWDPHNLAVHVERLPDDKGRAHVTMLRHPCYPYWETIDPCEPGKEERLFEVATRYLGRASEVVDGLARLLGHGMSLRHKAPFRFGWLPLAWGRGLSHGQDPRLSFWSARKSGQESWSDWIAVLVAAPHMLRDADDAATAGSIRLAGMSIGLRVVAHVKPMEQGAKWRIQITSLCASRIADVHDHQLRDDSSDSGHEALLNQLRAAIDSQGNRFGTDSEVKLTGFFRENRSEQEGGPESVLLTGSLQRNRDTVFAWSTTASRPDRTADFVLDPPKLFKHYSCMANRVFVKDPASMGAAADEVLRRPTRSKALLDPLRVSPGGAMTLAPAVLVAPARFPLVDPMAAANPQGRPRFLVVQRKMGSGKSLPHTVTPVPVPGRTAPLEAKTVPTGELELRSDDLAAAHAYVRAGEFFDCLERNGLDASDLFRMAALPLELRHRAAFGFQRDGRTVNAEVRPTGPTPDIDDGYDPDRWPRLKMRFGQANLSHREMLPADSGQVRPQYLGIAADRRWAWHEFSHVLIFASTGILEFPFCHSAGDALAAIVADPTSDLVQNNGRVNDDTTTTGTQGPMGGLTFPWVRTTRRHDRRADLGWCWCGSRNPRRVLRPTWRPPLIPTGYFEEQVLSSSLFTLYLALGGLLGNDSKIRQLASEYCVYLILRALSLASAHSLVPVASADQLVTLLVEADLGTRNWTGSTGARPERLGGTAHKVVRWAFENQGLYACEPWEEPVEGKGRSQPVDVYIPGEADSRRHGDYAPVVLEWQDRLNGGPCPGWHAAGDNCGIWLDSGSGHIVVQVGNRGNCVADAVLAQCWVSPSDGTPAWRQIAVASSCSRSIGPKGTFAFEFAIPSDAMSSVDSQILVFAQVDCPSDPSNMSAASMLPCSGNEPPVEPERIIDLVANDNNLGFRILRA